MPAALEHFQGVRDQVQHGFLGYPEAFGAHQLGQAGDVFSYNGLGGFGGDVAAAEAGAAGFYMAVRAFVLTFGFSAIGSELTNPRIRSGLERLGGLAGNTR